TLREKCGQLETGKGGGCCCGRGAPGITLADKSNANLVSVEVSNGSGLKLIVVFGYLPPEERHAGEFRENLTKLRNVIGELNGSGSAVVIGLDANSKSTLWNSPTEDWRGRELETVLEDNSLVVLNNNEEPTFIGHRGSSFIDFTAVNFRAYEMIDGWHLSDDETLSDHIDSMPRRCAAVIKAKGYPTKY
ncbi:hypothetical protein Trydic_g22000, partial [Trypoxylus dichotomus]